MEQMMNCPNCGAPITGPKCEYCGTMFTPPSLGTTLYKDDIPFTTLYTLNEVRVLHGFPALKDQAMMRRKDIEEQLKGPYKIKWI